MKRTLNALGAVALAAIIAACGARNEPVKPQSPPPPPQATVFDDLTASKERAKQDAERATEQRKENLDAAMKAAEGTTAP